MPKGALVTLLVRDVLGVPYVIAPEVLADREPVSVSLEIPKRELPVRVVGFLRGIGLTVQLVDGALYVSKPGPRAGSFGIPGALPGQGSPVPGFARPYSDAAPVLRRRATAVFRPANMPIVDANTMLAQLFPQIATSVGGGSVAGSDVLAVPRLLPEIYLVGPLQDVERALAVLERADAPVPTVKIEAVVAETRDEMARASAFAIVADLFGGRVGVDTRTGSPVGQTASIGFLGITAVASALESDGRFTIVSTPSVKVRAGTSAVLRAGSQVPTLSALTVTEDGQLIRSVEYRDSGNTLRILPNVVGERVLLDLQQDRSSFAQTDTGVNDSPTLNETSIQASLDLKSGQTVAVAGLSEEINSRRSQGVLGGIFKSKSRSRDRASVVVFIRATIEDGVGGTGRLSEIIGIDTTSDGLPVAAPGDGSQARSAASASERDAAPEAPLP